MTTSPSDWVVLPEQVEHIREEEEDDDDDDEHSTSSTSSSSSSSPEEEEGNDVLLPPPPSSSGDNPAMIPTRPSSRSRHEQSSPHSMNNPAAALLLERTRSPPLVRCPPISTGNTTPLRTTTTTTTPNNPPRSSSTPLSYEALANRPRSNPRVRTPMRYESPLNSNAFHRSTVAMEEEQRREEEERERVEGQRVTIRPTAGMAVGTLRRSAFGQNTSTSTTTTTHHQNYHHTINPPYHSRRKVRRWNNDKFIGIASDLAKYSKRCTNASEIFIRGEAEGYGDNRYRVANVPLEYKSEFARLATSNDAKNPNLALVRDKFIRGEVASATPNSPTSKSQDAANNKLLERKKQIYLDGTKMYQQIDIRLQKVLSRALTAKSKHAQKVIETFESFLLSLKADETMVVENHNENGCDDDDNDYEKEMEKREEEEDNNKALLEEILLRPPTISWKDTGTSNSKKRSKKEEAKGDDDDKDDDGGDTHRKKTLTAQFVFSDAKSNPQGGFHRLLLHAVCQFHGLNAHSTTTTVSERRKGGNSSSSSKSCKARVLTVTGKCHGRKFRLVDYALRQEQQQPVVAEFCVSMTRESSAVSGGYKACGGDDGSVMSDGVLVGHMAALDVSS